MTLAAKIGGLGNTKVSEEGASEREKFEGSREFSFTASLGVHIIARCGSV